MTLQRRWVNGVPSMSVSPRGTPMLTSADMAWLDQNEQAALDKTYAGCTMYGTLTLGRNGRVSLDSPTSKFLVTGSGATTSNGGRFVCGNGDVPQLDGTLTGQACTSFAEMFSNRNGISSIFWPVSPSVPLNWVWYLPPGGAIYSGTNQGQIPNGAAVIPVTRMRDGATALSVVATFVVNTARTSLPSRYPAIALFQYDPFRNETVNLTGWAFFPSPGTGSAGVAAYVNGGVPNQLVATITTPTVVNVGKYIYVLGLLDEDYRGESLTQVPNEYFLFYVQDRVADARPQ